MACCTHPVLKLRRLRSSGSAGGGVVAKDALGNDVKASKWLSSHKAGDHSLTQGLKVSR